VRGCAIFAVRREPTERHYDSRCDDIDDARWQRRLAARLRRQVDLAATEVKRFLGSATRKEVAVEFVIDELAVA
jgi:hypothetical protein